MFVYSKFRVLFSLCATVNVLCEIMENGRERCMIKVPRDRDKGLWVIGLELGHCRLYQLGRSSNRRPGVRSQNEHMTQFTWKIVGPYANC